MLADQIADAVQAARSMRMLDDVARVLWRAAAEGVIDENTAGRLSEVLETRRAAFRFPGQPKTGQLKKPPRRSQKSPERAHSIERRRRLAASGPMPPALASHFTTSQLAVLRIVADEVRSRGSCVRSLDEIAARAGVCRRTAQATLREAERLGLVTIKERRRTAWMNDPNVVAIVSPEWRAWLRLTLPGIRVQKASEHGHRSFQSSAKGPSWDVAAPSKWLRRGGGWDRPRAIGDANEPALGRARGLR